MELREYLRILLKNWWIVVPLTLIALTTTLFFSYEQTPVYEATATYVTKLDKALSSVGDSIYGLDILAGRDRIFSTYCEVMVSDAVRQDAYRLLNVDPIAAKLNDYTARCSVLPNTNVLAVIVTGYSPELLTRFGEAIGDIGTERANNLYNYFPVAVLDTNTVNPDPISPSHSRDAVLGGMLGLVVGISLAMLKEYLRSPVEIREALSIRDSQLGTYNARYFEQRLIEEVGRSRLKLRPMSVALIYLQPNEDFALIPQDTQNRLLRQASLVIEDALPQGNILAYMGKNVFAVLLPETPADEAEQLLQKLYDLIRMDRARVGDFVTTFEAKIALIESSGGALDAQAILARAAEGLKKTEQLPNGRIESIRTTPLPFGLDDLQFDQRTTGFPDVQNPEIESQV
jgi:capsular polysaccharide biosynthesis protein